MHPLSTYDVLRADHRERLVTSSRLRTREERRAQRPTDASGRPPERRAAPAHAPRTHGWTLTS